MHQQTDSTHEMSTVHQVFPGQGELSNLMRQKDWSKTSIGNIEQWPENLKSALRICLNCQYPIAIYWGSEGHLFYNDAWRPIVGDKHPWALGRPGREVWPEIWELVGPIFERVLQTGEGLFQPNSMLPMKRYGYTEECYFDYTFSPITGSQGNVEGIFNVVTETTYRVLNERRTKLLREIAARATAGKSIKEACTLAFEAIRSAPADIPFALLYLLEHEGKVARLYGMTGLKKDTNITPETFDLTSSFSSAQWPIDQLLHTSKAIQVNDLSSRFKPLPGGIWPEATHTATLLPLEKHEGALSGFLIIGVSPRRLLDTAYQAFHDFLASAIGTAINHACAYEEEKKRSAMLEEIDRAKTVFFSNVSHEFRTPLTLMLSPLEDALTDTMHPLPLEQRVRIELIQRNGLRLLKLVNSLLDFSRIEAKRMQAIFEPTDLGHLTANLASLFRSTVEKAGLKLQVETLALEELVYVDKEMWEKIIFNLLSNAFKFTLKGSIRVTLLKQKQQVELWVEDTGVGIPKSELPRLFERFHRIEGTQGRSYEGTGIGLALVQELVKLHGGTIQVESQLGQGTRFKVVLPLGKNHLPLESLGHQREAYQPGSVGTTYVEEAARWLEESSKNAITKLEPSSKSGSYATLPSLSLAQMSPVSTARIILADDNRDMRLYVKSLLEPYWQVEAVADGEAALQAILTLSPDLVLSDVMMPKLDGFGLLKTIRENPMTQAIPFILLSARAGEEAKIEGLQAGADDYLVKPFSARELLARVEANLKIMQIRKFAFQREQELIQQAVAAQADLEKVMNNLTDGFLSFDREWRFTYINQQGLTFIRKRREEVLGQVYWDIYPDMKDTSLERDLRLAMENGQTISTEFYYSSHERWYENRVYPQANGISVFFSDISPRKRLELEHKQALELAQQHQQQRLEEAENYRRKQTNFIDTLCHELRNPLNGIFGSVALLQEATQALSVLTVQQGLRNSADLETVQAMINQIKENVKAIEQCSQQQKVIVDDVLDLSKLEANKVELNPQPFSLTQQFNTVVQMFTAPLQRKNLKLTLELPEETWVKADPYRLSQILTNLVSNAIKFTKTGYIRIQATLETQAKDTTWLKLQVEDSGIGMTEEEAGRLFERFSQANRRTASEYGGSGLGLMISKQLVEMMGGTIRVTSQKDQGSCFMVNVRVGTVDKLEIKELQRIQELSRAAPSPVAPLRDKTILIVEDNLINQKILAAYLKPYGCRCEIAANGVEAVEKYRQIPIDLIFMDIEMPQMNGLGATQKIRELEYISKRHTPIIGLSGNAGKEQMQIALESGMDEYLTKPYQKQAVYTLLEKYNPPIPILPSITKTAPASTIVLTEEKASSLKQAESFQPSQDLVAERINRFHSLAADLLQLRYPYMTSIQAPQQWHIELVPEEAHLPLFVVTLILNQLRAYLEQSIGDWLMTVTSEKTALQLTIAPTHQTHLDTFMVGVGFTPIRASLSAPSSREVTQNCTPSLSSTTILFSPQSETEINKGKPLFHKSLETLAPSPIPAYNNECIESLFSLKKNKAKKSSDLSFQSKQEQQLELLQTQLVQTLHLYQQQENADKNYVKAIEQDLARIERGEQPNSVLCLTTHLRFLEDELTKSASIITINP